MFRGDTEGTELAENVKFLLGTFMSINNMLLKGKFTVQCESEVFEMINTFNYFVVNDSRCQIRGMGLSVDE